MFPGQTPKGPLMIFELVILGIVMIILAPVLVILTSGALNLFMPSKAKVLETSKKVPEPEPEPVEIYDPDKFLAQEIEEAYLASVDETGLPKVEPQPQKVTEEA